MTRPASLLVLNMAIAGATFLAAQPASHPRPQLMRRKWQALAAASSCSPARAGEVAECAQRIGLAPPENGQRVMLHVDGGEGELRVNGSLLARAEGAGGDGVDITGALRAGKEQSVSLRARGAARVLAAGWWEVVPAQRITRVLAETVPTAEAVQVTVTANGPGEVEVELRDGAQVVAATKGGLGEKLWLKPERPRLWSPAEPFLYQVAVRLASGDSVASYAAIRTVTVAKDARGVVRTQLNGQPFFFHGIEVGQAAGGVGVEPRGGVGVEPPGATAAQPPEPEAILRMGYNTVRLRGIAPAAWYSACDRAGLLVWQDLPAPVSRRATLAVVESLRVYPSIALWTLFDEGAGQEAFGLDAARSLAGEIARLDAGRLVNGGSGWFDTGNGQVRGLHFSPGPAMFDPGPRRASVLARYGRLAAATRGELRRDYRALMGKISVYRALGLSGAIYSPAEEAGFARRAGEEWLAALHQRMLANAPAVEALAGGEEPWEFTLAESGAAREGWRTGAGSFGAALRNVQPGTVWTAPVIRLRRGFAWKDSGAKDRASELYLVHWAIRGARLDVRLNEELILRTNGDGAEGAAFLALQGHRALRTGDNMITIEARRGAESPHAAFDARLIAVSGDQLGFADAELTRRPEYPLVGLDSGAGDLARLAPHFALIRGPRGRPSGVPPSVPFVRELGAATAERAYYALLAARADGFDGVALRLRASTPAEREETELTIRNIQEWMKPMAGGPLQLQATGFTVADFATKGARAGLLFVPTPEKPTPPSAVALSGFPGTGEAWFEHMRLLLQAAQGQWPLHVEAGAPDLFAYASYLLGVESRSASAAVRLAVPVTEVDEPFYWPIGEPGETTPANHLDRMKAPGTGIYQRRFANGVVAVNPGQTPQTLKLETSLLDPASRLISQRFELAPRSGKILLRPGTPGLADRVQ